jgi:hypothetical protein
MAYAISLAFAEVQLLDGTIDAIAVTKNEPGIGSTASLSTPIRYWRLRFGGVDIPLASDIVNERLVVLNRSKLLARASP